MNNHGNSRPPLDELAKRGFAAARAGEHARAAEAWSEARKYHPAEIVGWIHGAFAIESLGQRAAAVALLDDALQHVSAPAELAVPRAYIIARGGDAVATRAAWDHARSVAPHLADGWCHGAQHAAAMGDMARANQILDEARALLPNEAAVFVASAYLAEKAEDWGAADSYWNYVAKLTPDSDEVEAARARLTRHRAPGIQIKKSTSLALILKVKDDPQLMKHWIAYHAAIAGEKNLTILDCGSEDPEHLATLEQLQGRVNIIHYRKYYDLIHTTNHNTSIFLEISADAEYIAVLDADEYLFGVGDGLISAGAVKEILKSGDAEIFAGTWFPNTRAPAEQDGAIDWSMPIRFGLDASVIHAGTVAGKSIVRAELVFDVCHLGHNLHVKEVAARMTERSFGRIGIFHVQNLSPHLTRARIGKHLKSRGVIPGECQSEEEIILYLRQALEEDRIGSASRGYAQRYIDGASLATSCMSFELPVAVGLTPTYDQNFQSSLAAFDFDAVLTEARAQFEID